MNISDISFELYLYILQLMALNSHEATSLLCVPGCFDYHSLLRVVRANVIVGTVVHLQLSQWWEWGVTIYFHGGEGYKEETEY